MGWGTEPHEGWCDEKWPDGRWSGSVHRGGDPNAVAYQAVCSCGWRSECEHPVPERPANIERDERGISHGPVYDKWIEDVEHAETLCYQDWNGDHFEPLLGYEPHTQLILARSDGGQRHYLGGEPVNAGTGLELLTSDGHWLPVRYEWDWNPEHPPRAYFDLGLPKPARKLTDPPQVSIPLDPRAILRWPERT
jgi:hypothetical protein